MISDTLSDAIEEIETYLQEWPDAYSHVRRAIESTLIVMEAARTMLDQPPGSELADRLGRCLSSPQSIAELVQHTLDMEDARCKPTD